MRDYVTRDWNDEFFVPGDGYATERGILASGSAAGLVDYMNLVYTANQMTTTTWQLIIDAVNEVPGSDDSALASKAMVATLLTVTSPEFITQR